MAEPQLAAPQDGQQPDYGQWATLAVLVDRQAAAQEAISARLQDALRRILASFGGWYSDRDVAQMTATGARLVRAGQQQVGQVTAAYIDTALELMGEHRAVPSGLTLPANLRIGITVEQELERAVKQYRYQRSVGVDELAARADAEQRALLIADTDLTLAMRLAAQRQQERAGVKLWRRVIHPELSKGGVCGLCVVAADRFYKTDHLMPIHERCKCSALPIVGGKDPGHSLNKDDLAALYQAAGNTTDGRALKRVRIKLEHHSELGPVLRDRDHRFAGPGHHGYEHDRQRTGAVKAADPKVSAAAELRALEHAYADLQRRASAGEDVESPLKYQAARIAHLRQVLGQ